MSMNQSPVKASVLKSGTELAQATGGAEDSCSGCSFPFSVAALIIGVAVTAVAYTFDTHGSVISVLGLMILISGLLLLAFSVLCMRIEKRRTMEESWESQTDLVDNWGK